MPESDAIIWDFLISNVLSKFLDLFILLSGDSDNGLNLKDDYFKYVFYVFSGCKISFNCLNWYP